MRKYLIIAAAIGLAGCVTTESPVEAGRFLDPAAGPTFGSGVMRPGSSLSVEIDAGGEIDAATAVGGNCVGFVYYRPDYVVRFETSGTAALTFNVQSRTDPTLVVHTPDGRWLCNDDGGTGYDARLRIPAAPAGSYAVWVGTYDYLGEYPPTTLQVY